ncbi:MAG TPA: dTDP-glucose 4,6-dehydratase [Clostridiales bacterium]|nr:dTDP-glucose 4,6-dehydratase [Clostridiales bacterium]
MTADSFRRVLVTGGAGFIGSNYVRYALEHHPEWEVVVLDKLTYAGRLENLQDVWDRIEFVRGDIADPAVVDRAAAGADAVVNFAAETHVDRSLVDARPFVRTNVEGVLILLDACRRRGVRRFLQVSTDEVYGDLRGSDRHSVESDALRPRSPYAASKAAAEHLVLAYHASFGLDVVLTRASNTYGPFQYPEKIIPLFVTNALRDRPLPVYGDGSAVRDYLHVEDHCRGVDLVLHRGRTGQAYNLGARLAVSALEVARTILDLLGKSRDLITFVPDRPGHDYRYSVDPSRAEALGWRRRWDFDEGLAATVEWYLANREWWLPLTRSGAV